MPRTETGRVVYRRIKHPFTYTDVNRIVDKIEATQEYPPTFWEMGQIEDTLRRIYKDYLKALISIPLYQRHLIGWTIIHGSMHFGNQILDLIPDWSPAHIQIEWLD